MMDQKLAKRAAGERGASLVKDGMYVGLGTGSTTAFAIGELGRRVREKNLQIAGVPTSPAARHLARSRGVPLVTLDDVDQLDLALDGADEVDPALHLIKGRGAAHTREKVIAVQARRFVVLADPSKEVEKLGSRKPLPVEVVPMATAPVMRRIEELGGQPELRLGQKKDGPVVTDQGLWIVDIVFPDGIKDPRALNEALLMQPGVLDHGLFLDLATDVLIGKPDGSVQHRT